MSRIRIAGKAGLQALPLALFILLSIQPGYASSVPACSGTYTMDPSTGLPAGPGCEQVDKIFSSFSSDVNNGAPPSPGTIDVNFAGSSASGPISLTYSSAGWSGTPPTGSIFLNNQTQQDTTADPSNVITEFAVNTGTISGPGVQIVIDICTNDTTMCSPSAPNWGQIIDTPGSGISARYNGEAPIACPDGGPGNSISFSPSLDITSIFVTNWVIINNDNGSAVSIGDVENDYFEGQAGAAVAPEPSTFFYFGVALIAVVGATVIRRRHVI